MRALVLGGGGMFGAFQAGVWTVLSKEFPFDCVAGASAGALNAWAVASGVPGETLEQLWLQAGDNLNVRLRLPRYFLDGFLDNRAVDAMVLRLVSECRPRIPLAIALTDAFTLRRVLATGPHLNADHLLASCAIPFLLPAKKIDGRLAVDGGIRGACPVWAAWQIGASHAVAVDVWAHLPWFWPLPEPRRRNSDTLRWLVPQRRLGPLRASMFWQRANIEHWIAQGRRAAADALPHIAAQFARK